MRSSILSLLLVPIASAVAVASTATSVSATGTLPLQQKEQQQQIEPLSTATATAIINDLNEAKNDMNSNDNPCKMPCESSYYCNPEEHICVPMPTGLSGSHYPPAMAAL